VYAEEAEEERERYRGKALAQNEKVYPRSFPLVRCAELFRFCWRDACQKSSVMRKKESGVRGGANGLGEGGMKESGREREKERERESICSERAFEYMLGESLYISSRRERTYRWLMEYDLNVKNRAVFKLGSKNTSEVFLGYSNRGL
jgi:hypothetical protein